MWCRRQAAAAVLPLLLLGWLTGDSSEALSTFGKSNTQPPNQAAPTPPPDLDDGPAEPMAYALASPGHQFVLLKPWISNTKNQEQPTDPPTSIARACQRQAECAGISGSSCVRTHYDAITRCLCGDNLPPVNGRCESMTRALYHACSNSDECNDGLKCGQPNITGAIPPHLRVHAQTDRICICEEENGYREKDHVCSDAEILKTSIFAVLLVAWIRNIVSN